MHRSRPNGFTPLVSLLSIALLATGCATQLRQPRPSSANVAEEREAQRAVALRSFLEREARITRIASRLAVAGADLCGDDVRPVFGFLAVSAAEIPEDYRPAAGRLGLSEQVRAWTVVEGLPAEAAGLHDGDLLLAVDGARIRDVEQLSDALDDAGSGGIALRVRPSGEGEERTITLAGAPACAYAVSVADDEDINAMADGSRIVVNKGLLRFAATDDELALVVGHEIAHNALHHLRQNAAIVGIGAGLGLLLDVAAAAGGVYTGGAFTRLGMQAGSGVNRVFSVDHEQDADYMAVYLSERAGFRIDAAPDFWRRMAAEQPAQIEDYMGRTHPSSPERSAALQSAIEEIAQKKAARMALVPERE